MEKKERIAVIGNGIAGAAAVEHILERREGAAITIFGSEPYVNYNRTLLSSVLSGEKALNDIILKSAEWHESRGINLHLGVTVTEIDAREKRAFTEDGRIHEFDKLLIATGSTPFIPPIKGVYSADGGLTPRVCAFRDLKNILSIRQWLADSRKVIVIGGGLLGIEAAWGLVKTGLEVILVHLPDRLMETYLDYAAAEIVRKEISKLGIHVLLNHCADEIIQNNGRVEGVHFTNGSAREADIVIIAAGITPNINLASEAGLAVHKGILVNDYMETSRPDIYAVGECAEHRGKVYGTVAPILEQAKVAAEAIAGKRRFFYKGSAVTAMLKVAGIPVATIGSHQEIINSEELLYADPGLAIYKKLFLSGGRIVGAILLGDLEGYNRYLSFIQNQEDISLFRKNLIAGGPGAVSFVASMPDSATICGCMGVNKGCITNAIQEHGLTSVKEVSEKTGACTSCKGCAPIIEQILQQIIGGEYKKQKGRAILCDCLPAAWEEIRSEVMTRGLKSVSGILNTLGNGIGCEICKSGLNFMLSEIYLDDYEKEKDILFINDKLHANIQKDGTFSVVPRIYGGVTNPAELRRIAEAAEKYNVPIIKITGAQRIDLLGVPADKLACIRSDLKMPSGHAYTKAVRTCKTCVGAAFCRFGVQDSLNLGIAMEKRYQGIPCPGKVKMGVSGCPRDCAEVKIKDIGVLGIKAGWEVYIGGNGGVKVRVADRLAVLKTPEEALDLTGIFLQYYRENARWLERTSHFAERVGIEHIQEAVLEDKLGIADRLRKRIKEVIDLYKDPWAES